MAQAKKSTIDYAVLSNELETLLLELQRDDLDIDVALRHYERGLTILSELEAYLKTAENRVTELQAKFKPL